MYKVLKCIIKPIFYLLYRVKIIGKENLQFQGKMLVICNHQQFNDPIFLHLMLKQKIYFMAKQELFKNKLVSAFLRWLGAFSVERGKGDVNALKNAFHLLHQGKTVGIFPEGTRNKTGTMRRFHPGAAMIALRVNAPVLPVYIAKPFRPFRRTYVVVGAPISLNERFPEKEKGQEMERTKQCTKYLFEEMQQLSAQVPKK